MGVLNKGGIIAAFLAAAVVALPFADGYCGKVYLPAGMQIDVKFASEVSTKLESAPKLAEVTQVVSRDSIAGIEIFREGAKVFGEVTEFKKPGHLGKPGCVSLRIDSVQTAIGRNIAIRTATLSVCGKSKKLKALLMLPLLGAGYFVKGDDAVLAEKDRVIVLRTARFEEIAF